MLNLGPPPRGPAMPPADPTLGLDPSPRRGAADLFPPPNEAGSRRPRLLGRRPLVPRFRGRDAAGADAEDRITVEPRSDPASDAAIKRRIEQQIDVAVGAHIRGLDVKVVDRDVTVTAKVSRFWYRRQVKRTIESLPALAGYRTKIDVTY